MDWGDLRYFIALARHGSLSAAARVLRTEHTTVARRISALETGLGLRLFERAARGYGLTAEGERVAELTYRMEEDALAIERLAHSRQPGLAGTVRIGAPPALASHYLAQRLRPLRETHPGLQIELVGSVQTVSLSRREADIAVRLVRPEAASLVTRKLGRLGYGLYGAATYVDSRPPEAWDFVGYDESLDHVPQQAWLRQLAAGRPLVFRSNELGALQEAAAAGVGMAVLPRFMGDRDGRLLRIALDGRAATRELWLLVHPDLRRSARVRRVLDYLAEVFAADAALLDPP